MVTIRKDLKRSTKFSFNGIIVKNGVSMQFLMLLLRNPLDVKKCYAEAVILHGISALSLLKYSIYRQWPSELILFSISVQATLLLHQWDFSATYLSLNKRREYFQK